MSSSLGRVSRTAGKSVLSRETADGAGALVRRSIGTPALRNFTPFLMLDHFKIAPGAGFPDHPHRGMSTVTYLLKGAFEHEDFVGHRGKLGPGDLQFMIAGKGIVHAEMPIHGPGLPDPEGLQLWIDLPTEHKLTDPSYQELSSKDIPAAHPTENVQIKVICGETDGSATEGVVSSPVRSLGGCWYLDIEISKKGETVFQRLPKGWNTITYTLDGEVSLGESQPIKPFHTTVLSNKDGEEGVTVTALTDHARLVVISGEPLKQEIFQYGPFVMDTEQGIKQAFVDYRNGRNGFERAHNWHSDIGKSLM